MPRRRGSEWAVLLTLSLGFFMTLLDLTIVNIAIPDMRRALHASLAEVGWVINAYIIVLAVLMITAGRLGDLRGRRTLFLTGVAVFTAASAASGLSQNVIELIAARVVQGLGAALLLPQTMAIIIAIFPSNRRGAALGVWGSVAGLATIAGPTVGGMLVTWLGWRWIFFVNVPVGVIAIVLASLVIPQVGTGRRQPLDLPGVLIATASLVAITYGLVEGQSCNWGVVWSFISIPLILAVGVLLMVIFVLVQALRQDRPPLLPFSLFRDRNFALMSTVSVIISIGLVGMWLPMSLYLQTVLGFSPLKAGLTMAPSALVSGFTAPFAGRLADRGGKFLLVTGFTLYATGLAVIVLAARSTSHWTDLVPGYLIAGLGVGCTISPMQTIATRNVSPRLAGAASGVMNTARQTGSALGSAICLAILQNRLAVHDSFVTAMRAAIAVPIGVLLIAAVLCTAIRRGAVARGVPVGHGTAAGRPLAPAAGPPDTAAARSPGTAADPGAPVRSAAEAWFQPPPPEPRHLGRPAADPRLARPAREPQPARPAQGSAPSWPVRQPSPAPQRQPQPRREPWPTQPVREPWPGRSASPPPSARPQTDPSTGQRLASPPSRGAAPAAPQRQVPAPSTGAQVPAPSTEAAPSAPQREASPSSARPAPSAPQRPAPAPSTRPSPPAREPWPERNPWPERPPSSAPLPARPKPTATPAAASPPLTPTGTSAPTGTPSPSGPAPASAPAPAPTGTPSPSAPDNAPAPAEAPAPTGTPGPTDMPASSVPASAPAPASSFVPTGTPAPSTPAPASAPVPMGMSAAPSVPASAPVPADTSAPKPSPGPVREPSPGPGREPSPAPVREPSPAPVREPSPAPVRKPSPGPVRQPPAGPDRWHPWLLRVRHGDDVAPRERRLTRFLYPLRDDLLDRARLTPGETILDVGTGDGLIAFGALERVGAAGRVIFSDISQDVLDRCRQAVAAEGQLGRCDFRRASADALTGIDDASVDVVTTRSVLIYVTNKAAALREFHRVLKPGGRAVLVEPVSQLPAEPGWFFGYDVRPVAEIAAKVRLFYAGLQTRPRGPKLNFDDRDLVGFAERAGFREVHCQLRVTVQAARPPCPWGRFLRAAPGPQLPPFGEVIDHLLDPAEAAAFTDYLKPLVESGAGHRRQALAGLAAIKQ